MEIVISDDELRSVCNELKPVTIPAAKKKKDKWSKEYLPESRLDANGNDIFATPPKLFRKKKGKKAEPTTPVLQSAQPRSLESYEVYIGKWMCSFCKKAPNNPEAIVPCDCLACSECVRAAMGKGNFFCPNCRRRIQGGSPIPAEAVLHCAKLVIDDLNAKKSKSHRARRPVAQKKPRVEFAEPPQKKPRPEFSEPPQKKPRVEVAEPPQAASRLTPTAQRPYHPMDRPGLGKRWPEGVSC